MWCAALVTECRSRCQFGSTLVTKAVCRRLWLSRYPCKCVRHGSASHSANCSADASHHAQSNAHIGKLSRALIFGGILCYIESAFLLISIALLHPLGCLCLRINDDLLCFGLCVDHISLLFQLCLCDISILTEMQFLELFILWIAVRFNHRSNIEALELHAIIKKIGN